MDPRYAAALQRLEAGVPAPWSSSGSYIEDLRRQWSPSHHNTFERAMRFRMREQEHLANVTNERDHLQVQLRDARMEALKMHQTLEMQNSNLRLLNGRRSTDRSIGTGGSDPLRVQPPTDGVGPHEEQRAAEQQHDHAAAQPCGDGPPSESPDLGGHASEHGVGERSDGADTVASVPSAEGAVREGGEC